jgi:hypothetical protein
LRNDILFDNGITAYHTFTKRLHAALSRKPDMDVVSMRMAVADAVTNRRRAIRSADVIAPTPFLDGFLAAADVDVSRLMEGMTDGEEVAEEANVA